MTRQFWQRILEGFLRGKAVIKSWESALGGVSLSYRYDGSLLTNAAWSGTISGAVGFGYDNDFRVKRISVNGASVANYVFDSDGLLTTAGSMNLRRNAQTGFLTNTVLGSVSDNRAFGGFGEMTNYIASYAGSAIFSTAYGFDKLGRITNTIEKIQGSTTVYGYSYNSMGRLVEVSTNGAIHSRYSYDLNGNRTTSVFSASSAVNASYDAQDRLVQNGNKTYLWDANGSLLSAISASSAVNFSYDSFGNLLSASLPDGRNVEYVTDGGNRRVGKKVNGVFTQKFLYKDGLKPIAELDGSGNVVSYFIYGTRADIPDYMVKGGVTYRIIADHLGSPRLVVNASTGAIVQRMDFDEWGNVLLNTNPGFQPFGFAGGLYDTDTGLVRFGARDYDPETGRWTAKDPILFAGGDVNLYVYCGSDPVNFVDPWGLTSAWAFWDPNSAVGRQFVSIGDAFGAGAAGYWGWMTMNNNLTAAASELLQSSAANSGYALLDEECAGKGAKLAYGGALGVSAAASAVLVGYAAIGEIGAKAFTDAAWQKMGLEGLSNFEKGMSLIKSQGFLRALAPTRVWGTHLHMSHNGWHGWMLSDKGRDMASGIRVTETGVSDPRSGSALYMETRVSRITYPVSRIL